MKPFVVFITILIIIILLSNVGLAEKKNIGFKRMIYDLKTGGDYNSISKIEAFVHNVVYMKGDALAVTFDNDYWETERNSSYINTYFTKSPNGTICNTGSSVWRQMAQANVLENLTEVAHAHGLKLYVLFYPIQSNKTCTPLQAWYGKYGYSTVKDNGSSDYVDMAYPIIQDYAASTVGFIANHYPNIDGIFVEEAVYQANGVPQSSTGIRNRVLAKYPGFDIWTESEPTYLSGTTRCRHANPDVAWQFARCPRSARLNDVSGDVWYDATKKIKESFDNNKSNSNLLLGYSAWETYKPTHGHKFKNTSENGFLDILVLEDNRDTLAAWLTFLNTSLEYYPSKDINIVPAAYAGWSSDTFPLGVANPVVDDQILAACSFGSDAEFFYSYNMRGRTVTRDNVSITMSKFLNSYPPSTSCTGITITPSQGVINITTNIGLGGIYINNVLYGTGSYIGNISIGTYNISFGSVTGYNPPSPQTVVITANTTTNVTGNYTIAPSVYNGTLRINTTNASGLIYLDGISTNSYGYWNGSVVAKNHTVAFGTVKYYSTPATVNVNVTANLTTQVYGNYTYTATTHTNLAESFSNNIKSNNPSKCYSTFTNVSSECTKVWFMEVGNNSNTSLGGKFRSVHVLNHTFYGNETLVLYNLTYYGWTSGERLADISVSVHELYNEPISNYTSWNMYDENVSWETGGGYFNSTPVDTLLIPTSAVSGVDIFSFNITDIVLNDTTTPKFIFKVDDTTESQSVTYTSFYSYNSSQPPQLHIEYVEASAPAPNITSWGNNYTNNASISFSMPYTTTVNLNATSDQTVSWKWYSDEFTSAEDVTETLNSNANFSWTAAGEHTVSVYGTNNNGSTSVLTWTVTINEWQFGFIPNPVINTNTTVTDESILYQWSPNNTGNRTDGYSICYYVDADCIIDSNHNETDTSYLFNGREQGTLYSIRVIAFNLSNEIELISDSTLIEGTTWTNATADKWQVCINDSCENVTVKSYNYSGSYGETVNISIRSWSENYSTWSMWVNSSETIESESATTFISSSPINLANTSGNFWVNHTWEAGLGNVTNSYNISQNGTWTNGSTDTYFNASVGAHGWSNISVYAYNSSGALNSTPATMNTQVSNNVPVLGSIGEQNANEGAWMNFSITGTDADNDSLTCSNNKTVSNLTGCNFNWSTGYLDSGVYVYRFYLNDSYTGSDYEDVTITINEMNTTPAINSNLNNITSNSDLAFDLNVNNAVLFSAGANQTITTWIWGTATKLGGDGTTNSTSSKYFDTVGAGQTVTVYGTNANGTTSTLTWTVNVVASGGEGTTHRSLSGTVTPSGSTITTTVASGHTACSETGGAYSCQYSYHNGDTYWINVSKTGYTSNNTQVLFDNDIVWNVVLVELPTLTITSWTPTSLATIRTGTSQQFEITSSTGGIDTYHWKFDGADVGDGSSIYTKTFLYNSSKRNQDHTVSVYGTNETQTSNTVTWSTTVLLTAIKDYDFDKNFSDIGLSGLNPTNLSMIGASPYVQGAIGTIFWGVLFAIIFIMIWMRQDDVTIPSLLGLIIGLSLWAMMPKEWVSMASSLSIISFFGIMYTLIKGRR